MTATSAEAEFMRLYGRLLEKSPDGVVVGTRDGVTLRANAAACRAMGYSEAEFAALGRAGLVVDEQPSRDFLAARRRDGFAHGLLRMRRKDGSTVPVEVSSWILPVPSGEEFAYVVFRDVSERKGVETALRRSEALLRTIADSTPDAIYAKDLDGRWTFANAASLRVVGKPPVEVLGHTDAEITGEGEFARRLRENDRQVVVGGIPLSVEEQVPGPEGLRSFLTSKAPLRDADGRTVGVVGVSKDITDRKRAEEALRQSEALLAGILRESPAGFALLRGKDYRYEIVSPAYQAIGPRKQMVGRAFADAWPEMADRILPTCDQVMETGEPFRAENVPYDIDRDDTGRMERAYFTFIMQRLPAAGIGEPALLVTALETTRMVKAEEGRREAQARADLSARLAALGTLVAGVGHEINNPLAAAMANDGTAASELAELEALLCAPGPLDRAAAVRLVAEARESVDGAVGLPRHRDGARRDHLGTERAGQGVDVHRRTAGRRAGGAEGLTGEGAGTSLPPPRNRATLR